MMDNKNKYFDNEACSKNEISRLMAIWHTPEGEKIISKVFYGYLTSGMGE